MSARMRASVGALVPSTNLHHHVDHIVGGDMSTTIRYVNKVRGVSTLSTVIATAN